MKTVLKRVCMSFLAFATLVTTLPITQVHAESTQYWTESIGHVGMVEQVMNDGSISASFNEGHLMVEGEEAFCV